MENVLTMYAIYDRLAESYAAPFVLDSRVANRTFGWMKKETDAKDRQDKEVRVIGYWDNNTGEITPAPARVKVYELSEEETNG